MRGCCYRDSAWLTLAPVTSRTLCTNSSGSSSTIPFGTMPPFQLGFDCAVVRGRAGLGCPPAEYNSARNHSQDLVDAGDAGRDPSPALVPRAPSPQGRGHQHVEVEPAGAEIKPSPQGRGPGIKSFDLSPRPRWQLPHSPPCPARDVAHALRWTVSSGYGQQDQRATAGQAERTHLARRETSGVRHHYSFHSAIQMLPVRSVILNSILSRPTDK